VYERAIALFDYPHVYDVWILYLTQFCDRYGGQKLERARDLFEQAIEKVPGEYAKDLYLLYARLEEEHGLIRHAMNIYSRATKAVDKKHKMELFKIYIARAEFFFGVTKTRDIYEEAIATLPEDEARQMCLSFATLEQKMGEVDRARAIYSHAALFSPPAERKDFWQRWHEFELRHGNPDTFREMLRIRRTVHVQHSKANFVQASLLERTDKTPEEAAQAALAFSQQYEARFNKLEKRKKKREEAMKEAEAAMEALSTGTRPPVPDGEGSTGIAPILALDADGVPLPDKEAEKNALNMEKPTAAPSAKNVEEIHLDDDDETSSRPS